MPPAEEAAFIALWTAGTESAAIAHQLGVKATTAHSGLGVCWWRPSYRHMREVWAAGRLGMSPAGSAARSVQN